MVSNRNTSFSVKALGIIKVVNAKVNPLDMAAVMESYANSHELKLVDIWLEFDLETKNERNMLRHIKTYLEEEKIGILIVPTLVDISDDENEIAKFMNDMDKQEILVYELLNDTLWLPEKRYSDLMLLLMCLESDEN